MKKHFNTLSTHISAPFPRLNMQTPKLSPFILSYSAYGLLIAFGTKLMAAVRTSDISKMTAVDDLISPHLSIPFCQKTGSLAVWQFQLRDGLHRSTSAAPIGGVVQHLEDAEKTKLKSNRPCFEQVVSSLRSQAV